MVFEVREKTPKRDLVGYFEIGQLLDESEDGEGESEYDFDKGKSIVKMDKFASPQKIIKAMLDPASEERKQKTINQAITNDQSSKRDLDQKVKRVVERNFLCFTFFDKWKKVIRGRN